MPKISPPFCIHLSLLLLFLLAPIRTLAQDTAPKPLEPIGEEAFQVLIQFFDYDKTIPLEPRIVEKTDQDGTIREKLVFRGVRGFLVPGYLEMPKEGKKPFPLVLLLHGWSGGKANWWEDDNYISGGNVRKALLKEGYAVFALDALAHGDRIAENDYALPNNYTEEGVPTHHNYFSLTEIVTQTVVDYRRGLDCLSGRAEIDMNRIGTIGYSMGGVQTFLLTAVEPRVRVSVACVPPSSWPQIPISPVHYAHGIGERPFLMLMGRTDSMCPVEHAEQTIGLIPGPEKNLIFYDSGHKLTANYVPDAVDWFKKYLPVDGN
jgi:dienelactone hydrolase